MRLFGVVPPIKMGASFAPDLLRLDVQAHRYFGRTDLVIRSSSHAHQ